MSACLTVFLLVEHSTSLRQGITKKETSMGKGHKDRRKEKRALEMEEREKDERTLKNELEEDNEKQVAERELLKKQTDEPTINEKSNETSSDTDSGRGSSVTTTTESPEATKVEQPDTSIDTKPRRSQIKGLLNIGNTCFFNVIIQSLAHTSLLTDTMYQTICILMREHGKKYSSTTTAQLLNVLDEFSCSERKKGSIDPKPLFNTLIQKLPAYKGYDQHDTHELFMNLMLILRAEEIELRKLKPAGSVQSENDNDPSKMFCLIGCNEPYTTYDSVFGGHLLDVITCQKCSKSLMKIEPFLGLLLPLTDRMTPEENHRTRRKRDDYTGSKSKKEPKLLSRKQQKALKKQEKKNSRHSAKASTGKLKGRQAAKEKAVEEQLPLDELTSVPPAEEPIAATADSDTKEPADVKTESSGADKEESAAVEENDEEAAEEESDEEDEAEGPLTAVESTCMLADMVSKLTLIHETTSRPLPFVDEGLSRKFLNCHQIVKDPVTTDETDSIRTLEQCFQRYFKPETLSGENRFDCYYCRSLDRSQQKALTEATRQTVFFQLPPILPLFLKRFQMYGSHSEKINKFIEFPLELDLTGRCSSQVTATMFTYSLYAVIEHSGTLRSGHYTAYIKQSANETDLSNRYRSKPIDELLIDLFGSTTDEQHSGVRGATDVDPSAPPPSWYHISDNTIHKVPESKVLAADAYVLFYRRL